MIVKCESLSKGPLNANLVVRGCKEAEIAERQRSLSVLAPLENIYLAASLFQSMRREPKDEGIKRKNLWINKSNNFRRPTRLPALC